MNLIGFAKSTSGGQCSVSSSWIVLFGGEIWSLCRPEGKIPDNKTYQTENWAENKSRKNIHK